MKAFFTCFVFLIICLTAWNQPPMPMPDCAESPYVVTYCKNPSIDPNDSLFIWSGKSDLLFGITDKNDREILPCKYERIFIERSFRDSCHLQLNRVILRENDEEYAIDLLTKKQTRKFKQLFFLEDRLIGEDSSGWVIVDQQLNESTVYPGSICCFNTYENSFLPIYYNDEYTFLMKQEEGYQIEKWTDFQLKNDVLAYGVMSENQVREIWAEFDRYGLINTVTGQMVDAVYSRIMGFFQGKKLYYWAQKIDQKTYDPYDETYILDGSADIYTTDLVKIGSYSFAKTPDPFNEKARYQMTYPEILEQPLLLWTTNGKAGAVSVNGEVCILFEYDSIIGNYCSHRCYNAWKNGKAELLDAMGSHLLRNSYYNIFQSLDSTHFIVQLDEDSALKSLVDCDEKVVLDCCSDIWNYHRNSMSPEYDPKKPFPDSISSYFEGIRDSTFFLYIDDQFYKVDSTNFNFTQPKIIDHYLVKSDGKIALKFNYLGVIYPYEKSGYVQLTDDGVLLVAKNRSKYRQFESGKSVQALSNTEVRILFGNGESKIFDMEKWDFK